MATDPRLEQLFAAGLAPYQERQQRAQQRAAKPERPMVLTVWQPWAWALVYGSKRVENRGSPTAYRGRVLIHAGLGPSDWDNYVAQALSSWPRGSRRPDVTDLRAMRGHVIGEVTLVDVRRFDDASADPWAVPGQWGWIVRDPTIYAKPFEMIGKPGLRRLPREHEPDLRRAGARYWSLDDLDVVTSDPSQAMIALSLAGVARLETRVRVNRKLIFFGELAAEAARWAGHERMATRFETALADRLAGTIGGPSPWTVVLVERDACEESMHQKGTRAAGADPAIAGRGAGAPRSRPLPDAQAGVAQ